MNRVGRLVNRGLGRFGFRLTRHHQVDPFPVEVGQTPDRAVVEHVAKTPLTMGTYERLYATLMACHYVVERGIPGDFCECGVWRGGNSIVAADVFSRIDPARSVYLYDTFSGMTAPTTADAENADGDAGRTLRTFQENQRSEANMWCYASLEDVQQNFRARGLLGPNVLFRRGDVMETLSESGSLPQQLAVLRLDTDWYESTRKELEVLWPRLSVGGVLIVDDYGWWKGARKAVDEFFAARPRPFFQYVDYTCRLAVKLQD